MKKIELVETRTNQDVPFFWTATGPEQVECKNIIDEVSELLADSIALRNAIIISDDFLTCTVTWIFASQDAYKEFMDKVEELHPGLITKRNVYIKNAGHTLSAKLFGPGGIVVETIVLVAQE